MNPDDRPQLPLEEKLRVLPKSPGVYIFRDAGGKIIYIGKASVLRNRVRSYFQDRNDGRPQFEQLVSRIRDVEVIPTDSELEALMLESTLIRQEKPRFNIDLRDDKSFPFLRITSEPYPRIFLTRHPVSDGSKYYGPFSDLFHLKGLLRVLRGLLKIRTCNLALSEELIARGKFKSCLEFHIGRCNAPCVAHESRADYLRRVADFHEVVSGKGSDVIQRLEQELEALAERLKFEEAAQLRDWLSALNGLTERQKVISAEPVHRDVIGLAVEDDVGCMAIFQIRNGRMVGRLHYRLRHLKAQSGGEILQSALEQYYADVATFPTEVYLPDAVPDEPLLRQWLQQRAGHRVELRVPERGEKAQFVELAQKNAALLLGESQLARQSQDRIPHSLKQLQAHFKLPALPVTIAAFDISNLMGTDKVASMVVFVNGRASRSQYRRYQIKGVAGIDDFAAMKEVVGRRFLRLQREHEALPDLVLIDGGKGQLHAALDALHQLGVASQPILGLAKTLEEVYIPGDPLPLNIPRNSSALKLLQQVRDEAHRFAVFYHRQLRKKRTLFSVLDEVDGIGPARRKLLLTHFQSLKKLEGATLEELESVAGIPPLVARSVFDFFHPPDSHDAV
ncbi:excinuclease ABC subunit C [candidate division KSB1 bacterium]|nr:excinuclease ABC subunit C [candidate division KSB1 bacterium]